MSTLIICLPQTAHAASLGYDFLLTPDGIAVADHASAPVALLPSAGQAADVVAVVPSALLSWHAVELPKGVGAGAPRLRAILESLLEDRLLDEPAQLHFALAPVADGLSAAWVAVCDRAWLVGHLQALEAAGRPATRIVPEFAPDVGPLQVQVVGDGDQPFLLVTGKDIGGVMRLPLGPTALALIPRESPDQELAVLAEPAVVSLAEELFQHKVGLMTRQERWLDAFRSGWDLAQFDLASSSRIRTVKRMSGLARELLRAPGWRPARWGVAVFLLANLLGLNIWAWKEQSALQASRAAVQSTLTQTFPRVKVVVDAPLQMEREVATLRQATGATSGRDLEAMLAALGSATPVGRSAGAIEFAGGEAKVKGLQLSTQEATSLTGLLRSQGYAARQEGDAVLIKQDTLEGLTP